MACAARPAGTWFAFFVYAAHGHAANAETLRSIYAFTFGMFARPDARALWRRLGAAALVREFRLELLLDWRRVVGAFGALNDLKVRRPPPSRCGGCGTATLCGESFEGIRVRVLEGSR